MSYVGRFAPSPTGPLHLGSLVAAVASYLAARHARGRWLVRIEDIDPPRESPGAATEILRTLERFALHWDGDVLYQSRRMETYRAAAEDLLRRGLAYRCACSRSALRRLQRGGADGPYPGYCRDKAIRSGRTAVRLRAPAGAIEFDDALQGRCRRDIAATTGDYVIYRKDGLPAYHLAVVLDDAFQGVTHVVRGVDLLDSTAQHIHLQRTLGLRSPEYGHVPVVVNDRAQKLSKQTGAAPLDSSCADQVAFEVLGHLGLAPPRALRGALPGELWGWAAENWRTDGLAGRGQIVERDRAMADGRTID